MASDRPAMRFRRAVRSMKKAKEAALRAIQDEMAEVAKAEGIVEMLFYQFTTLTDATGRQIDSAKIRELEKRYCDLVDPRSFFGRWSVEDGWG